MRRRVETWVPVVDLGCGSGDWLATLPPRYDVCGVEISEALARQAQAILARREGGGRMIHAPAIEALAGIDPGKTGDVLMRSFLEHELQPSEVLRLVARTLHPGGAAIIKVSNYGSPNRWAMGHRWCGFRFPDHVNYFTATSLRAMVEAAGLHVAAAARWPCGDNMWMVAPPHPRRRRGCRACQPQQASRAAELTRLPSSRAERAMARWSARSVP